MPVKVASLLFGFALQLALWLAAPVEALPVQEREPARAVASAPAPSGPAADLATGSLFVKASFARVVATLQACRSNPDVRNSSVLIDTAAPATRVAVAEAIARLVAVAPFVCTQAVATFATWLPPPVLPVRSH